MTNQRKSIELANRLARQAGARRDVFGYDLLGTELNESIVVLDEEEFARIVANLAEALDRLEELHNALSRPLIPEGNGKADHPSNPQGLDGGEQLTLFDGSVYDK